MPTASRSSTGSVDGAALARRGGSHGRTGGLPLSSSSRRRRPSGCGGYSTPTTPAATRGSASWSSGPDVRRARRPLHRPARRRPRRCWAPAATSASSPGGALLTTSATRCSGRSTSRASSRSSSGAGSGPEGGVQPGTRPRVSRRRIGIEGRRPVGLPDAARSRVLAGMHWTIPRRADRRRRRPPRAAADRRPGRRAARRPALERLRVRPPAHEPLPRVSVGRHRRFYRSDVAAWLPVARRRLLADSRLEGVGLARREGARRRARRPSSARGVVQVAHRRLDVGVAHPLLDLQDRRLGRDRPACRTCGAGRGSAGRAGRPAASASL